MVKRYSRNLSSAHLKLSRMTSTVSHSCKAVPPTTVIRATGAKWLPRTGNKLFQFIILLFLFGIGSALWGLEWEKSQCYLKCTT